MDCTEARNLLLDRRRGTLADETRAEVARHLATCEACRHEDAADRELSKALEERLPRRRAPAGLRSAIESRVVQPAKKAPSILWRVVPAAAVTGALGFAAATALFLTRAPSPTPMFEEAVNDHLRVLYSTHPVDIESGGVHQVKPWFEGRLDFAPIVGFGGDDEFPLQGGAVAYFLDRQAAAFLYKRNLHVITLFVFRAGGLPWPSDAKETVVPLGHVRATARTSRGFHELLWRDGEMGYALVSDLNEKELGMLGARIAGP